MYWQSQEGLYEHVRECMALLEEADPKAGAGSGGVFLQMLNQTIAGGHSKCPPCEADLAFAVVVCTYLEMLRHQRDGSRRLPGAFCR